MWTSRLAAAILVGAATVLAGYNIADEFYLLGSWNLVFCLLLLWMAAPFLCGLVMSISSNTTVRKACFVLLVCQALLFLVYALNGSTQDRETGSQHMHLLFVPVLLLSVSACTVALVHLLDMLRDRCVVRG